MRWWLLLILVIGITIFFVPIPFIFQESAFCQPCDPSIPRSQCPKCPQKGDIGWKPSLFQIFLGRMSRSSIQGELLRKDSCERSGGTWLEKYQECEHITRQICTNFGGTFNECDSPCRHDPAADKCITLCVAVCTFPYTKKYIR